MNTLPDSRRLHRIGIAYMAVAAVTFPIKDSFLKAQDAAVPALLAIAIYLFGPPVIAAVIGMISSLAMIKAAQLAPAAKLAPASYLEIASGALIGIFVFGEFLDWLTLSGILIIVGVCLTNSLLNEIEANSELKPEFPKT